jgi:hypothetical protein
MSIAAPETGGPSSALMNLIRLVVFLGAGVALIFYVLPMWGSPDDKPPGSTGGTVVASHQTTITEQLGKAKFFIKAPKLNQPGYRVEVTFNTRQPIEHVTYKLTGTPKKLKATDLPELPQKGTSGDLAIPVTQFTLTAIFHSLDGTTGTATLRVKPPRRS